MNQLQKVFNYQDTQVRTIVKDGKTWFVAKDVCEILEISKHRDAVSRLGERQRGSVSLDTLGGKQQFAAISEAGLYKLVFRSNKPEAEKFTDWVTEEVLPEIKKTGQYNSVPKDYKEALLQLVANIEEKEKLEAQNKLMAPKADMYDILLSADNAQTMAEVAKAFGLGRNKLFSLLREKKVLMSGGPKHNLPYQRYIDNDHFEVREVTTIRGEQNINVSQTLVTAKGLDLIGRTLDKMAS